jgi:hypothetical protein
MYFFYELNKLSTKKTSIVGCGQLYIINHFKGLKLKIQELWNRNGK